ncbi:phage tail tape measure protein [Alsobacter sp. KACC 23698]|uniref:Phage tail tape measure protein n=1 Tax=Alsobacter sp. KACC 23698 TaxID=3149229 RepID=A0AAU7JHZ1_9HYPH
MADLTDLTSQETQLKNLDKLAQSFDASIASSFAKGASEGRRFEDILRTVGQRLQDVALKAAFKPLDAAISGGLQSLFRGLAGQGGLFAGSGPGAPVQAFADGGVVRAPTFFPMGGGLGLAGEAGPEAILPLARGADGKLGVRSGPTRGGPVTIHIATPDAESFRRSEAQVSAAIARAVARGQRGL